MLCFCMHCAVHPLCVVSEEKQPSGGRSILAEGELDVGEGVSWMLVVCVFGMHRYVAAPAEHYGCLRTHGGFEQMDAVECDD